MKTHKEMTEHIRTCIKRYGIKASVTMQNRCGDNIISVAVSSYSAVFSAKEINNICMVAKSNGLTFVRGMEIIPRKEALLTYKQQWDFRYNLK